MNMYHTLIDRNLSYIYKALPIKVGVEDLYV